MGMTLFLCAVIFTELSIDDDQTSKDNSDSGGVAVDAIGLDYDPTGIAVDNMLDQWTTIQVVFWVLNYILLTFFMIEIILKLFAFGWTFLMSFINVFDSIVVFISFMFLVINIQAKFVGLLRILRLIKVITEMKKQSDEAKARKEAIKAQKKQSTSMASHVERIIDFLDRIKENKNVPKFLSEDIEWAIEVISANKLYKGDLSVLDFNIKRPEIQAWMDKINMNDIIKSYSELGRLAYYEAIHNSHGKKRSYKFNIKLKRDNTKGEYQKITDTSLDDS